MHSIVATVKAQGCMRVSWNVREHNRGTLSTK